jgi:Zn-dependent protease with chaperone function
MLDSLIWVRSVAGSGGGGFLSTHPGIDDRIATIERLR